MHVKKNIESTEKDFEEVKTILKLIFRSTRPEGPLDMVYQVIVQKVMNALAIKSSFELKEFLG
jgi:hypothetical protein